MKHNRICHGTVLDIRGYEVKVEITPDYDADLPWESCDGMGVIREVRRSGDDKLPGERRFGDYFFDVCATTKEATRDGWGLGPESMVELTLKLGRAPTKKEITAAAVESQFQYLKAWADDEWQYYGYTVTLMQRDDADELVETDKSDSCGGYECWQYDDAKNAYLYDEIRSAAEQLVKDAEMEQVEVQYWNERDVVTA